MGGIPVDRKKKTNLTESIKNRYKKSKELTLIIIPSEFPNDLK